MFGKEERAATGREMAIFRLEAKVFSREKRGRSVIAVSYTHLDVYKRQA